MFFNLRSDTPSSALFWYARSTIIHMCPVRAARLAGVKIANSVLFSRVAIVSAALEVMIQMNHGIT
jgi:hypothetical protein